MIHLVSTSNRHLYEPQLRAMHVERKRLFVDGRGWRLPVRSGGEYDQFDDDEAIYLIGFDNAGDLCVSARLHPTLDGGVIADVFPHLLSAHEQPVRAPGVFECTRYFTSTRHRGLKGFEARSRLHVALIEAVQYLKGERLIGLSDPALFSHLRRFSGLRLRALGPSAAYEEGGETLAFEIGVSTADLEHAHAALEIHHPQLFVAPDWLPVGADVLAIERSTSVVLAAAEPDRTAFSTRVSQLAAQIVYQPDVEALLTRLAGMQG